MQVLARKTAIVTGAGQGIGRGVARALAAEGATVVIAEINEATGRAVAEEIGVSGGRAHFVVCDVGDAASVKACAAATLEMAGGIDILVNNAVFGYSLRPFEEHDDSVWLPSLNVAVLGTFRLMQAFFASMRDRGGGRIINFGSMAGYQAWENGAAYATVKEAVRTLSKVAAREWGRHGITVNTICPFANSPGWLEYQKAFPKIAQEQLDHTPIGRVGDCEADIGRVAVFLCGPDAAFITGHTVPVDGGCAIIA